MWNSCLRFVSKHLYLVGGTVVVGAVAATTGAFTIAVIGYSVSYGLATIVDKVIR